MYDIPFIFYDDMEIDNVIEVTNTDVDVTLIRRWNTDDPIDVRRYVDKRVVRQKLWLQQEAGTRQDQHQIDTDKFERCHWFKWMILYLLV
jgi:hypothetical protein